MADWGRKAIREIPPSCGQQHARTETGIENKRSPNSTRAGFAKPIYIYIYPIHIYMLSNPIIRCLFEERAKQDHVYLSSTE